jgi:hypothetical protein
LATPTPTQSVARSTAGTGSTVPNGPASSTDTPANSGSKIISSASSGAVGVFIIFIGLFGLF